MDPRLRGDDTANHLTQLAEHARFIRYSMGQLTQFITNHWQLCAALIVVLLFILVNEIISQKKRAAELSPAAAIDMINHDDALVIDIRDTEAFRTGHIINAIRASSEDFQQQRLDKYKDKPLILVCQRGLQAQALAQKLRGLGFSKPMVLAGGIAAWQSASLPVVKK